MSISRLLRGCSCTAKRVALHLLLLSIFSSPVMAYDILLGTGNTDTFSYFVGKRICHSVNSHSRDVTCRLLPMQNYAASLTNLEGGALDLALVNAKMLHDALNSEGMFRYLDIGYENLRLLMPVYKEPVVLAVRGDANISSLDDLAGKRVNAGPVSSMTNIAFREIMRSKGWNERTFNSYQTLSPTHAQDVLAFNNGDVQAMVFSGMHPDKKLSHGLTRANGGLVGIYDPEIKRLIRAERGFSSCAIPAGKYAMQNSSITTVALENLLVTSADTDEEAVLVVLQAIVDARDDLKRAHTSLLDEELGVEMLNDRHIAPHPAAIIFFQDHTAGKPY